MALILDGTNGLSDVDGSAATPAIRGTDANTGIFFPAADTIAFSEGGAEVARFDSAGNLGIGITGFNERLNLQNSAGRVSIFMASGSTNQGYISYFNSTQQLSFGCGVPTGTGANGGQQVNIDVEGNLLVGTTSNPYGAGNRAIVISNGVAGTISLQPSSTTYSSRIANLSGSIYFDNNSNVGYTASNGNASFFAPIAASAFNVSSDYRLKENIAPLTGAIEKIQNLKPVNFSYKSTNKMSMPWGSEQVSGFLAHEFAEVVPTAVTGQKDAVDENDEIVAQTLDMTKAIPLMVAAIQELKVTVDAQAARIAALEAAE
jgi:hypothetical protein